MSDTALSKTTSFTETGAAEKLRRSSRSSRRARLPALVGCGAEKSLVLFFGVQSFSANSSDGNRLCLLVFILFSWLRGFVCSTGSQDLRHRRQTWRPMQLAAPFFPAKTRVSNERRTALA